jgi:hypothetical protein
MKILRTFFFISLVLFLAVACAHRRTLSEARASFDRNDFDEAVLKSVASLKAKPGYTEALALLKRSAPLAHESHIKNADEFERLEKFDAAVGEYADIKSLAREVESVNAGIVLGDVSARMAAASGKAADVHYKAGKKLLAEAEASRDREKFMSAAGEFGLALHFVEGHVDAKSLYDRARRAALLKVAVLPFKNACACGVGGALGDDVTSALARRDPEFYEFIPREKLPPLNGGRLLPESAQLDAETLSLMLKTWGTRYVLAGKVISAYGAEAPGVDVHGTLTCNVPDGKDKTRKGHVSWVTHERRSSADLSASYELIDAESGKVVGSGALRYKDDDVAKWMEYWGEDYCLPWEIRYYGNRKTRVESSAALLGKCLNTLADDMAAKILRDLDVPITVNIPVKS